MSGPSRRRRAKPLPSISVKLVDAGEFTPWIRLWSPTGGNPRRHVERQRGGDQRRARTGLGHVSGPRRECRFGVDGSGTYQLTVTH